MAKKTLVGQSVGKYRIDKLLGRGGMAEVYKAYQENLDRYVAIKVMHSFLADEEGFLARFKREAKAMASLNQNNIVSVYDFEVEEGMYYIVMEFVSGGTLKQRLELLSKSGDRMPLSESVQLVMEVAGALSYAHKRGMVHRDIKPGNIMLDEGGHAILTDFGIAKILSGPTVTATGAMIGTPAYMSPEQGLGQPGDERSDLYALGVLFYQMSTGRLPYDADTPLAVILKHVNEPVPQPAVFNEDIPQPIQDIIVKAMAKNPDDRFQSAQEMMLELKSAASASDMDLASAALISATVRDRPTPIPKEPADATRVAPPAATIIAAQGATAPPPADATRVAPPSAIGETEIAVPIPPTPPAATEIVTSPVAASAAEKKGSKVWIIGLVVLLLIIALAAGGFFIFGGSSDPTPTPEEQLAVVDSTPSKTSEPTATIPEEILPTADNVSTAVALIAATLTAQPTNTPQPTATSAPENTPTPDVTATFLASCVEDVELVNSYTYENENSNSAPIGSNFTMNWVLRNSGTCPLPAGLKLIHSGGHEFGDSEPVILESLLDAGVEETIIARLVAPNQPGEYESIWQLVDESDNLIGPVLEFAISVYEPWTPTPRPTNTPEVSPTPVVVEPFGYHVSLGNCVYQDRDWVCDMFLTPYGGIGPYTVLVSDALPPSRFEGAGPFTHSILGARCNPWVNTITARDEGTGQELSEAKFYDPNSFFEGGCTFPP